MSKIRPLSLFTLAMINVATIGSVKNWPITAEYGLASVFFLVVASLLFFIPTALVAAELATGWPEHGGIFLWVKEAFGHRVGFLAIWLQWIQNVVWYPTILAFISGTLAYAFNPALADNKVYTLVVVLAVFWAATIANLQGMRISGWISSAGTILGTFIPGGLIIVLGVLWLFLGKPLQISLTMDNLIPDMSSIKQIVFFSGIVLSLMGMEMPAVHAKEVQDPQKTFPKAILLSIVIILGLSIPGVLAIAFVVPQSEINLLAGSIQAFASFVKAFDMSWMIPIMAVLIGAGAIASLSTWLVGPSKGLLTAAQTGDLPPFFRKQNKHHMPSGLLIFQGIIVTVITFLFLFMPTLNAAFWFISAIVAQLYLVMYFLMFAAAIKLRYTKPDVKRAYTIPGKKFGIWAVCGIGFLTSVATMVIGFFPPDQIQVGNIYLYLSALAGGVVFFCLGPYIILLFKSPKWVHPRKPE
ncbi:MAG: amino acid permease [Chlamydiales bacterium]|nr:amino acid permease [Chlamydiales bacterium]